MTPAFDIDVPAGSDAFIGFDPGRDKCGLAILDRSSKVHFLEISTSDRALARIQELVAALSEANSIRLVMGDRTTSKQWAKQLRQALPDLELCTVDEHNSSQEARKRYWDFFPPKGVTRLIPLGLREPPRPIDDIAAVILVERYLQQSPGEASRR
ncbi:MAG: Holliday junction resolvase RuvX [Cyanobacteria bacterium J06648_11]